MIRIKGIQFKHMYRCLFAFLFNLGSNWENCVVELEQTGTPGEVDFGTLSVFGSKKHKVRIIEILYPQHYIFNLC